MTPPVHCPACKTPFVHLTFREDTIGRLLRWVKVFSFRCQLCTYRFRALRPAICDPNRVFDRREYKRLATNFPAIAIVRNPLAENAVMDLSMGGCTLRSSTLLAQGSFVELLIKPLRRQKAIKVDTAIICSVHRSSMGVKFLELNPDDKRRLSQVVFNLLSNQGDCPPV